MKKKISISNIFFNKYIQKHTIILFFINVYLLKNNYKINKQKILINHLKQLR